MAKIDVDPRLPIVQGQSQYLQDLSFRLTLLFRAIANQIDGISEGSQAAFYTALLVAPTTGKWALGDFVLNKSPAETGTVGSKYIIHGWRCVSGGSPGTWVQCRYLTGN